MSYKLRLLLGGLLCFLSCNFAKKNSQNSEQIADSLAIDSISRSVPQITIRPKNWELTETSNGCEISDKSCSYVIIRGLSLDDTTLIGAKGMDAMINTIIRSFFSDPRPEASIRELAQTYLKNALPGSSKRIAIRQIFRNKLTVSIFAEDSTSTGGTTTIMQRYGSFRLTDGAPVMIPDLFEPSQLADFMQFASEKFQQRFSHPFPGLPGDNLYLAEKGIVFCYLPNEYSTFAQKPVLFELSYHDIKKFFSRQGKILILKEK